jgi:hypothetical protein
MSSLSFKFARQVGADGTKSVRRCGGCDFASNAKEAHDSRLHTGQLMHHPGTWRITPALSWLTVSLPTEDWHPLKTGSHWKLAREKGIVGAMMPVCVCNYSTIWYWPIYRVRDNIAIWGIDIVSIQYKEAYIVLWAIYWANMTIYILIWNLNRA